MKIENHILSILQLYEYAMAIGKSLDYEKSCDLFLTLLLKRKNLNAAWILEKKNDQFFSKYSIPYGKEVKVKVNDQLLSILDNVEDFKTIDNISVIREIAPIKIINGLTVVCRLKDVGYLFFYTVKDNLTHKDLSQLIPVIEKFSINLKACKAFEQQQVLLKNLEIQNQELSDYAHMVSHDLKSPLRSIDTLSAWIKEDNKGVLDQNCNAQLDQIRENVEKMDALINGILNYSTISKQEVTYYDVDLNNLMSQIITTIHIPDHITLKINNLPEIKGDKNRLLQLFQNLIDNAIKYNDKEKGLIEIGFEDQNKFWQFYVKDNGMGIEQAYFDKIFKTFEKLENSPNSSGIGLSIVKKIVDLYQGNIWLESEKGKGTKFYFTIKK